MPCIYSEPRGEHLSGGAPSVVVIYSEPRGEHHSGGAPSVLVRVRVRVTLTHSGGAPSVLVIPYPGERGSSDLRHRIGFHTGFCWPPTEDTHRSETEKKKNLCLMGGLATRVCLCLRCPPIGLLFLLFLLILLLSSKHAIDRVSCRPASDSED